MPIQSYTEREGLLHKISRNTRESSLIMPCKPDVSLVYRKGCELKLLLLLFNYRQLDAFLSPVSVLVLRTQ